MQNRLGVIFGVTLFENMTNSNIQEIVKAKAKRTQEIAHLEKISLNRAAHLTQEELLTFAKSLNQHACEKLLNMVKVEQNLAILDCNESIGKSNEALSEAHAEIIENEIRDFTAWNYAIWGLLVLLILGGLIFIVK